MRNIQDAAIAVIATATLIAGAEAQTSKPALTGPDNASNLAMHDLPPSIPLQAAIRDVSRVGRFLNTAAFPISTPTQDGLAQVQSDINRWSAYSDAVANLQGDPQKFDALADVQAEMMGWVESELSSRKISLPTMPPELGDVDPKLKREVTLLVWGIRALLAHNGVAINDVQVSNVAEDPKLAGRFCFTSGNPAMFYGVQAVDPAPWVVAFKDVADRKISLVAVKQEIGDVYKVDARGTPVGTGSFMAYDRAFIDVGIIGLSVQNVYVPGFRRTSETVGALAPMSFEDSVRALVADGKKYLPNYTDHITELKTGGVALHRLAWRICTHEGSTPFDASTLEDGFIRELVYHEARHVTDGRATVTSASEHDRDIAIVERVRCGAIKCAQEDRNYAETLIEARVRLESMEHSSTYLLRLIGEWRAGFAHGEDQHGVGAKQSSKMILDGIIDEIKANPVKYGVTCKRGGLTVGDVRLSEDEQVISQLDVAVRTEKLRFDLAKSVYQRLDLDGRMHGLAERFK